jgi:hypothetical protein
MFVAAGRAGIMRSIASPSTAIHDALVPQPGDIVVRKARDVLLGRIFPRRAQIIDTATLRGLLSP